MKILKKAVSLVLSAVVVAGLGSVVSAADTNINIKSTFPDKNFQAFLKKYDTDNNGYLYYSELMKIKSISVDSSAGIEDFTGIEYLKYTRQLIVFGGDAEEIDLSNCYNISDCKILGTPCLRSFKAGPYLDSLEISLCDGIKTLDLSKAYDLEEFKLVYNRKLKQDIDLSATRFLKTVEIYDTPITSVKFNALAQIDDLIVAGTKITSINLTNMDFNRSIYCYVYDNPNLTSICMPKNSFTILQMNRTKDGSYKYSDSKSDKRIYIA